MLQMLMSNYFILSMTFIVIFAALAVLLHIQFSMTGITNFGIAGIWGLGLYATGVFVVKFNMPYLVALILAVLLTAFVSWLLGLVVLDLDGGAVLVATLAFATIIENLVFTEKWLTMGVMGLGTVHFPFTVGTRTDIFWLLFMIVLTILLIMYTVKMKKAPYGRMLQSINDNEPLSRSLGKPTFKNKLIIFVVTCALMGLIGAMSAPVYKFLYPRLVSSTVTFTVWIALMLGGRLRVMGGPIGVLATVGVFDLILETFVPIPTNLAPVIPNIKYALYGLMLMLVLMFRPLGILGKKKEKTEVEANV